jgi:hypothetical protein
VALRLRSRHLVCAGSECERISQFLVACRASIRKIDSVHISGVAPSFMRGIRSGCWASFVYTEKHLVPLWNTIWDKDHGSATEKCNNSPRKKTWLRWGVFGRQRLSCRDWGRQCWRIIRRHGSRAWWW